MSAFQIVEPIHVNGITPFHIVGTMNANGIYSPNFPGEGKAKCMGRFYFVETMNASSMDASHFVGTMNANGVSSQNKPLQRE